MTATLDTVPPPSPDSDSAAECALLEHALGRLGIHSVVTIGTEGSHRLHASSSSPDYAIHLTQPVPVHFVLRALTDLHGKKRSPAVLLTTTSSQQPYREQLQLDANARVLGIRRNFQRGDQHARPPREQLLGIAWKLNASHSPAPPPNANYCWQTARTLLRRSPATIRRHAFPEIHSSANTYFAGPTTRHRPVYNIFKRIFDIFFSLAALLATLPICVAVAVIIKAYDRGPIFFVHQRESRNGRPFGCLKFRTMVRNAHELQQKLRQTNQVDGPQFKMARDPRITPIGQFLRKSNIDELPQFLNVLVGHMSVVGPRPSPFEENQLCPAWREARLSVKPGITGLWQVSRSHQRGPADFQEWILYDTQYVERRSFWLDAKIVLLTIKELFGKGQ